MKLLKLNIIPAELLGYSGLFISGIMHNGIMAKIILTSYFYGLSWKAYHIIPDVWNIRSCFLMGRRTKEREMEMEINKPFHIEYNFLVFCKSVFSYKLFMFVAIKICFSYNNTFCNNKWSLHIITESQNCRGLKRPLEIVESNSLLKQRVLTERSLSPTLC